MAFDNDDGAVAVSTTATVLASGIGNGVTVAIQNVGTDTVYVGGSDVTAADGYPVAGGSAIGYVADDGDELYGICDSGDSSEIRVLRQGV